MVVESMIKQGRDPFKVEKTFMEKKRFWVSEQGPGKFVLSSSSQPWFSIVCPFVGTFVFVDTRRIEFCVSNCFAGRGRSKLIE